MKKIIQIAAAMAVIIGSGLVHGAWTNRWGVPPALKDLARRIESLPEKAGTWSLANSATIKPRELAMTGAVGYVSRQYVNVGKGESVSLLVLTGLPGKIGTHTPEACYPGAGYVLEQPEKYSRNYGDPPRVAEFQTSLAKRGGTNPSTLRIFWTWRSSKGWSSPGDARWSFATEPSLTKVYVIREVGGSRVDPKDDPSNTFMTAILPLIDEAVTGGTGTTKIATN